MMKLKNQTTPSKKKKNVAQTPSHCLKQFVASYVHNEERFKNIKFIFFNQQQVYIWIHMYILNLFYIYLNLISFHNILFHYGIAYDKK